MYPAHWMILFYGTISTSISSIQKPLSFTLWLISMAAWFISMNWHQLLFKFFSNMSIYVFIQWLNLFISSLLCTHRENLSDEDQHLNFSSLCKELGRDIINPVSLFTTHTFHHDLPVTNSSLDCHNCSSLEDSSFFSTG